MPKPSAYSLEIEGLVSRIHKLEADLERLSRERDDLVNFIRTSAFNAGKFVDSYDPPSAARRRDRRL